MKAENDAAIAAAKAAWPLGQTHRVGDVPPNPVTPYNVIGVDAGSVRNYRHGSLSTSRRWTITVQSIGATYNEVTAAVERGETAFLNKSLTPGATRARRDLTGSVLPDSGLFYVLNTYTYTTPV